MSYTSFEASLAPQNKTVAATESVKWAVKVVNTGGTTGGVVLVCYVKAVQQAIVAVPPSRSMFDFHRLEDLNPGQAQEFEIVLTPLRRSLVDEMGSRTNAKGVFEVWCEAGGVSSTRVDTLTVM